jgi:hypothetical protein
MGIRVQNHRRPAHVKNDRELDVWLHGMALGFLFGILAAAFYFEVFR